MMKTLISKILAITVITTSLMGCENDWLDEKSDKSLVVPTTLKDFQDLLDYSSPVMNANYPALGEIGADNYYISNNTWQSASARNRNAYTWAKKIYESASEYDWNFAYQRVLYCNTVLEGLEKTPLTNNSSNEYHSIKGSALFFRAHSFYDISQVFAPVYKESSAETDLGIPLRLKSDINEKSTRANLKETYERIINDLKEAAELLPLTQAYKTRPTKVAALGLLARVYLSMQQYDNAFDYADAALKLNSTLLDYNTLDFTGYNPFLPFNEEMVFYSELSYSEILYPDYFMVDSNLVKSYEENDLRSKAFFTSNPDGSNRYIGSYSQSYLFGGIANDEIYLIRAECNAWKGKVTEAMNDLNALLLKRFKIGTFEPLAPTSTLQALTLVLEERRKELLFRGLRWTDLRRLNMEPQFAITLKRNVNGNAYELPPNDSKYVYPIPDDVVTSTGMQQNPR